MVDISPVPTLGSSLAPLRAQLATQTTKVAPVGGSGDSAGTSARMDTDPNAGAAPKAGSSKVEPEVLVDENTPTGPPPSFQANVLDLERDLQRAIERLESERSRVEADAAMKIERAEARAEKAEAEAQEVVQQDQPPAPDQSAETSETTPIAPETPSADAEPAEPDDISDTAEAENPEADAVAADEVPQAAPA